MAIGSPDEVYTWILGFPGVCLPASSTFRSSRSRAVISLHKEPGQLTYRSSVLAHGDDEIGQVRDLPTHLVNLIFPVEYVLEGVPSVVRQLRPRLPSSRCNGRQRQRHVACWWLEVMLHCWIDARDRLIDRLGRASTMRDGLLIRCFRNRYLGPASPWVATVSDSALALSNQHPTRTLLITTLSFSRIA